MGLLANHLKTQEVSLAAQRISCGLAEGRLFHCEKLFTMRNKRISFLRFYKM